MDNWLKALVACACVVVIVFGAWHGAERLLIWNADRIAANFAKEQALRHSCNEVAKNYNLRLKGVGASGPDSNSLLAARARDCAADYPDVARIVGSATSEALDDAMSGSSVSYKD